MNGMKYSYFEDFTGKTNMNIRYFKYDTEWAIKGVCSLQYRNTNSYFGGSGDEEWVKESAKETNTECVTGQSSMFVYIVIYAAPKLTMSGSS